MRLGLFLGSGVCALVCYSLLLSLVLFKPQASIPPKALALEVDLINSLPPPSPTPTDSST
ncbi:hypothetical protein NHP21005_05540 [Helicobacter sp. NHP21005]|uniref:hypothetical protein n=1 Tax=Helicobacter felistomachi TaxID=3040201 RepID=UPI002573D2C8|nr:hypothetical protein [Helicobacter sp. NHP21005]BEG56866.1 hypothetical protein NHP21005_05540 [Helicobacter sp. NHP21005]